METVLVQHKVTHKNGTKAFGYMDGEASLQKAKGEIRRVKAKYITGEIMDHCNEIWSVKPSKDGKTTYETVSVNY